MGGALVGGLLVGSPRPCWPATSAFVRGPLSLPAVLALMVVMLAFRPAGLFGRSGPARRHRRPAGRHRQRRAPPRPAGRSGGTAPPGAPSCLLGVVPGWPSPWCRGFALPVAESRLWTEVVATTVVLWGLGLLIGPAGQLSLGHGAFVGLGRLLPRPSSPPATAGRPYVGVVLAALIGFVVGCVLGLPALRIKGQYLAMVTLSFAVVFPMIVQRFSWFTGGIVRPPGRGQRDAAVVVPPRRHPAPVLAARAGRGDRRARAGAAAEPAAFLGGPGHPGHVPGRRGGGDHGRRRRAHPHRPSSAWPPRWAASAGRCWPSTSGWSPPSSSTCSAPWPSTPRSCSAGPSRWSARWSAPWCWWASPG